MEKKKTMLIDSIKEQLKIYGYIDYSDDIKDYISLEEFLKIGRRYKCYYCDDNGTIFNNKGIKFYYSEYLTVDNWGLNFEEYKDKYFYKLTA